MIYFSAVGVAKVMPFEMLSFKSLRQTSTSAFSLSVMPTRGLVTFSTPLGW